VLFIGLFERGGAGRLGARTFGRRPFWRKDFWVQAGFAPDDIVASHNRNSSRHWCLKTNAGCKIKSNCRFSIWKIYFKTFCQWYLSLFSSSPLSNLKILNLKILNLKSTLFMILPNIVSSLATYCLFLIILI